MRRYLAVGGIGLLVLIVASVSCGAMHAGAAGYQTGWYYPYYPWYWGGLYYHYPWVNTHYVEYHGGYSRDGTLASGYRYDPVDNVVLSRTGDPVYPNPKAIKDIKPAANTPDPHSLNPSPDTSAIKAAAGGCSGQNSCTGGGNAVTNKSGGTSSGHNAAGCSGQASCTGGGNAVTNKSGGGNSVTNTSGGSGSGAANAKGSGGSGSTGSKGSGGTGSKGGSSSGGSRSSGSSHSSGGSRSGGGKR